MGVDRAREPWVGVPEQHLGLRKADARASKCGSEGVAQRVDVEIATDLVGVRNPGCVEQLVEAMDPSAGDNSSCHSGIVTKRTRSTMTSDFRWAAGTSGSVGSPASSEVIRMASSAKP